MDPNAKALFGEGFTREGGRLVARSPPWSELKGDRRTDSFLFLS
jgi:hypothetical protein